MIAALTRVGWTLKDGSKGTGRVLAMFSATETELDGHVLVAVDPKPDAPSALSREVHPVIWCTVTWLTVHDAAESTTTALTTPQEA